MKSRHFSKFLLIVVISSLVLSCGNKRYSNYYIALSLVEQKLDYSGYDYILFIPYRGCGGCVGTTIDFLKKNTSTDVLKIFYDFNSLKDLKIRLGQNLDSNTVIDMGEEYFKVLGPTMYPAIVDVRTGDKGHVEILDPYRSTTFWNEFKSRHSN